VDALKSLGLSLAVGSGITAAVYWLMSQTALWWLWAWLVALAASLILSVLAPVLILPLFFKTSPLPDGELRTRLLQLALKANLKIAGIYTVEFSTKTSTANAALMGLGRTRRIVLSDTILGTYSADEILVIMSHEMGHQKHGDTWRLFLFQGLILLGTFFAADIIMKWGVASLGYEGITDVAALPLFLLAVGAVGIITGPILSYFSRYLESQADLYALKLTGNPGAFISAMTRLTDQNLSEASPPRWVEILLDDHPSFRQRVDMARGYLTEG
jgi:STE24 endopeptidase